MSRFARIATVIVVMILIMIGGILYFGLIKSPKDRQKAEWQKEAALKADELNARNAWAMHLEDSLAGLKHDYYYCYAGAAGAGGQDPAWLTFPDPKRQKCCLCCGQSFNLENVIKYTFLLQDSIEGYSKALKNCMEGKKRPVVIIHRARKKGPCPPCPTCPPAGAPLPVSAAKSLPITSTPAPDDELAPEMRAALKGGSTSSNPGEPVNLSQYQGYHAGPFGVTISPDGYTQYFITDQMFRASKPTIAKAEHNEFNGPEYTLESDGYWTFTDRSKGKVMMENLFNQTLAWSVYTGQNTEGQKVYPMFIPHEFMKLKPEIAYNLNEYRKKSAPPSVWTNGRKYTDDPNLPDEGQGWEFRSKYIFKN